MMETAREFTRELDREEKVAVLRNHIDHLVEEAAGLRDQIRVLIDDNAEIDFMTRVDESFGTPEIEEHYAENVRQIRRLKGEVSRAEARIGRCREALREHRERARAAGQSTSTAS